MMIPSKYFSDDDVIGIIANRTFYLRKITNNVWDIACKYEDITSVYNTVVLSVSTELKDFAMKAIKDKDVKQLDNFFKVVE